MFCHCSPYLINFIFSIITHVYTTIYDVKVRKNGIPGSTDQFFIGPQLDEDVISMMVHMGFLGSSAKEALKCVETITLNWLWICSVVILRSQCKNMMKFPKTLPCHWVILRFLRTMLVKKENRFLFM